MTEVLVRKLAGELFRRHGLVGWGFGFNRRKRGYGLCRFGVRRIELSSYWVATPGVTEEMVTDILLHEIAHALVGHEHGHDAVWKNKCRMIGARPVRCGTGEISAPSPYVLLCPTCGQRVPIFRIPKRTKLCAKLGCHRNVMKVMRVVRKS